MAVAARRMLSPSKCTTDDSAPTFGTGCGKWDHSLFQKGPAPIERGQYRLPETEGQGRPRSPSPRHVSPGRDRTRQGGTRAHAARGRGRSVRLCVVEVLGEAGAAEVRNWRRWRTSGHAALNSREPSELRARTAGERWGSDATIHPRLAITLTRALRVAFMSFMRVPTATKSRPICQCRSGKSSWRRIRNGGSSRTGSVLRKQRAAGWRCPRSSGDRAAAF